jgi:hypothetical protein
MKVARLNENTTVWYSRSHKYEDWWATSLLSLHLLQSTTVVAEQIQRWMIRQPVTNCYCPTPSTASCQPTLMALQILHNVKTFSDPAFPHLLGSASLYAALRSSPARKFLQPFSHRLTFEIQVQKSGRDKRVYIPDFLDEYFAIKRAHYSQGYTQYHYDISSK